MSELVSVCMLTYNHEKYINDSLTGILSQTYPKIELFILDDASSDSTVEIIESRMHELEEKLVSVKLMKHIENSGNISKNFNEMIQLASGEFIKVFAGDDIMLENCIEDLVNCFNANPSASIVYGNAYMMQENYSLGDRYDKSVQRYYNRVSGYESEKFYYNLLYSNRILAPTSMVKKNIFSECGLYDEQIDMEDYEFWLRLASSEKKFYYLNHMLVLYRWGGNSISNFTVGDYKKKIDFGITSIIRTKEKYLLTMPMEEQIKYWEYTFCLLIEQCQSVLYEEGLERIKDETIKYGVDFDCLIKSVNTPKESKIYKEAIILDQWIDKKKGNDSIFSKLIDDEHRRIAIFGYTRLGRRLKTELKYEGINPLYIIDRRGDFIMDELPVYTIDDDLPPVDVVIVTAMGAYNEVNAKLRLKTGAEIYDLVDFLFD